MGQAQPDAADCGQLSEVGVKIAHVLDAGRAAMRDHARRNFVVETIPAESRRIKQSPRDPQLTMSILRRGHDEIETVTDAINPTINDKLAQPLAANADLRGLGGCYETALILRGLSEDIDICRTHGTNVPLRCRNCHLTVGTFVPVLPHKRATIDAIQAAIAISQHDVHAYRPHIGVASGPVIVGYAGTALRYDVSVFGAPVALAARCAAVKPDPATTGFVSSTIVAPESDWTGRALSDFYQTDIPGDCRFQLLEAREVPMKGIGDVSVRELHNTGFWAPSMSAEARARLGMATLRDANRYWPRMS